MLEFINQRNTDFITACRRERARLVSSGSCPGNRDIVRHAINGGAPSYYVSHQYASRMLSLLETDRLPQSISAEKRKMWNDIAASVETAMTCHRFRRRTNALAAVLTGSTAQRFYISETYGLRLFYRLGTRRRARRRNRRLL